MSIDILILHTPTAEWQAPLLAHKAVEGTTLAMETYMRRCAQVQIQNLVKLTMHVEVNTSADSSAASMKNCSIQCHIRMMR